MSWWLQDLFDRKPELITREKTRFANYYLEDFKLTAHDKQGKIKYILQANRLDNYDQESVAEIQGVRTTLFNKNSNWIVSANQAKIFQGKNKIEFNSDVIFTRPAQASQTKLTLKTEQITFHTDKDLLETSSHVTITSEGTRLEANGLRYDNQKGTFELTSDVKGTYVK